MINVIFINFFSEYTIESVACFPSEKCICTELTMMVKRCFPVAEKNNSEFIQSTICASNLVVTKS